LSRRIGADPLLTQASSGNTSVKFGGKLWVKRSGAWLANAGAEMFVPLNLTRVREQLNAGFDLRAPGASVETAMHALLPDRVVAHVHSVNAIAWSVREDAQAQLAGLLDGLRWRWIPYVPSGLQLARKIAGEGRGSAIFVLANHGLVICGKSCSEVEIRLGEVERRLHIQARQGEREVRNTELIALDAITAQIIGDGVLFPCQSIFLEEVCSRIAQGERVVDLSWMGATERAVLEGVVAVARRIPAAVRVRYLSPGEVRELQVQDVHHYRMAAERQAPGGAGTLHAAAGLT
jgi:ribulose-5-phosphate 4-epimerase/fuculose-1-phosphate aldolase